MSNARNQVFTTEKALSPMEASMDLFIGAPTHAGRGKNVVEFTVREGVELVPAHKRANSSTTVRSATDAISTSFTRAQIRTRKGKNARC